MKRLRHRVNQVGRDRVAIAFLRERFATHDVVDDRLGGGVIESRHASKVAIAHRLRGDSDEAVVSAVVGGLVKVEVEEHFLLEDGTADRSAEVVVANGSDSDGGAKAIISRIQRIVLKVFIGRTVELIGTALADLLKTMPPIPYCAEKLEVMTWSSETVSKMETSALPLEGRVVMEPSARMALYGRLPLAETYCCGLLLPCHPLEREVPWVLP